MLPENISLQIDVGDCAHQHAVAHQNVRRDGDFFRFGRHDDTDVRHYVEIDGVLRLIDPTYSSQRIRQDLHNQRLLP